MTVTEKIIRLVSEQDILLCEGKTYRPEVKARLAQISEQLQRIRETCPLSWANAARLLGRGE